MHIPWVGMLSAAAAAVGLYTLYWYDQLSSDEKELADQMAEDYALQLYDRGLDQLTRSQLTRVQALVQSRFAA